jgi:hypothetical protein
MTGLRLTSAAGRALGAATVVLLLVGPRVAARSAAPSVAAHPAVPSAHLAAHHHSHARKHSRRRSHRHASGPPPAMVKPRRLAIDSAVLSPLVGTDPSEGIDEFALEMTVADPTAYNDDIVVYLANGACASSYPAAESYVAASGLSSFLVEAGVAEALQSGPSASPGAGTEGTFKKVSGSRAAGYAEVCAMLYTSKGGGPSSPEAVASPVTYETLATAQTPIIHGAAATGIEGG